MSEPAPRVSIGLPVYNGAKYLQKTLESILSQTFEDFELIISDNASDDGTKDICESYASSDKTYPLLSQRKKSRCCLEL